MTRIANRSWHILCWNIRGINSTHKWAALRSKIHESKCDIICLQETKRENFDHAYVKNFCPHNLTILNSLPQLGLWEEPLLYGKVQNFWGKLHFKTILP
jgi:endonuclease/exonuclease/phosphatase family metal-dependent hydrolase